MGILHRLSGDPSRLVGATDGTGFARCIGFGGADGAMSKGTRLTARDGSGASSSAGMAARMPVLPALARPVVQIKLASVGCVAIGAAWLMQLDPFGHTGLLLLLLPFVGVLLPLVNAPFELALGFVVLSYFRLHDVFPVLHGLHLPELMAVATLAALGWHLLGTRRLRPFWSFELALFALFFTHVTVGIVFSTNRSIALGQWSGSFVKIAVITLAIAWLAKTTRHFALASRAFVLAGLVVGAAALWNKTHGIDLVEGTRVTIGRDFDSVLGDPNDLSLVLLFPTSFALALICTRGSRLVDRALGAVTFVTLVLAILATQSRGGLLGLVAVCAPFARQQLRSRLALAALVALGVAGLFAAAGIGERETASGEGGELDESSQGRLWAWETAVNMAIARPLTGVGLGTFRDNYYFYTEHWNHKAAAAHSTWFEVLGETGFPGLILYAAVIGVVVGKLLRTARHLRATDADVAMRAMAAALTGALAGFAVAGTFLSQGFTWPIYINLALATALCRQVETVTGKQGQS